jgi:hypothetical protein
MVDPRPGFNRLLVRLPIIAIAAALVAFWALVILWFWGAF